MKRVVVDHFGGPEVLKVVEEQDPQPGRGEVLVRVLAAGVSYRRAVARRHASPARRSRRSRRAIGSSASSKSSVRGCSRLRVGVRIGALTVFGADAERLRAESGAVDVPEDLDPGRSSASCFRT